MSPLIALEFIMNDQILLITIFSLLLVAVFVLDAFLDHKTAILYMLFGAVVIVLAIIWVITQIPPSTTIDVTFMVYCAVISLMLGTAVHSGILPEKVLKV